MNRHGRKIKRKVTFREKKNKLRILKNVLQRQKKNLV